ncbi:hypothetical protein [Fodinicola feengrottensis]|uniref:hypothetical protein n=1 Tax=Fodinicola feengrottensis TaxID=435914 RepID=UPI0013D8B3AF|nr:hypothetical protein [Fodinicola feengrottensis]
MFEEELDALQSRDDSKVAASVERLLAADTGIAFGADPTQLTYRQLVDLCWSYEWSIARIEACQLAVIAEQLRRALSAGASQVEGPAAMCPRRPGRPAYLAAGGSVAGGHCPGDL